MFIDYTIGAHWLPAGEPDHAARHREEFMTEKRPARRPRLAQTHAALKALAAADLDRSQGYASFA
jgi:hypothetical protein